MSKHFRTSEQHIMVDSREVRCYTVIHFQYDTDRSYGLRAFEMIEIICHKLQGIGFLSTADDVCQSTTTNNITSTY